jgi:hypothetical protein
MTTFFRIRKEFLEEYNRNRAEWNQDLAKQGLHQSGSCIWFGRCIFDDGSIEEFSKDCLHPIKDLSKNSPRSEHDALFCHNLQDIDDMSVNLGIFWHLNKDQLFASSTIYIGFLWDLYHCIVSLSQPKVDKYLSAIHSWRKKPTHVLQEALKLYGKLMHACAAVKEGEHISRALKEQSPSSRKSLAYPNTQTRASSRTLPGGPICCNQEASLDQYAPQPCFQSH